MSAVAPQTGQLPACVFDPVTYRGALGQFHCPDCGEMIVAGVPHPDYSLIYGIAPEPVRIQRSRKKGYDMQVFSRALNGLPAKYVGRRTPFGNDYRVMEVGCLVYVVQDDMTGYQSVPMSKIEAHAHAVEMYEKYQLPTIPAAEIEKLRGYNLSCFCGLDLACHCDPLLKAVNK